MCFPKVCMRGYGGIGSEILAKIDCFFTDQHGGVCNVLLKHGCFSINFLDFSCVFSGNDSCACVFPEHLHTELGEIR